MKRSPTYYHNRKLLKELENTIKYRPSVEDVREWFDILNEQIFGNKLPQIKDIWIQRLKGVHALYHYWSKKENEEPELSFNKVFESKKLFVEILAHEMIHHFQAQYDEPVDHGDTFDAWSDNFKIKGLNLYKVE